jgi:hypothetical protein
MFDLALDSTGNLYLTENQDLATITQGPEVAQACNTTTKTQRGEWFLDAEAGIDHLGIMLDRRRSNGYKAREVRRALSQVEEVTQVIDVQVTTDPDDKNRILVDSDVLTIYGVERISV